MCDFPLSLELARGQDEAGPPGDAAELLEDLWPDDQVGGPRLVLDREEDDPARRLGTLPADDEARDPDGLPVRDLPEGRGRAGSERLEGRADVGDRVLLEREAHGRVVLDDGAERRERG